MTSTRRHGAIWRFIPIARRAAGIFALAAAVFFVVGPERFWVAASGSSDQGAVDPTTVVRRAKPTDSLACSARLCTGRLDLVLPLYPLSPEALMARLDAVVLSDARNLRRVDDASRPRYRRYVALTPVMRFPDTIDALGTVTDGGSGLALYGRSKFGVSDWGVNQARIEAWIEALDETAGADRARERR